MLNSILFLVTAFSHFYPQGSVLNFFLTKSVEEHIGLSWTLWGGAFLCLLGFVAAILTSVLDIVGVKQLGQVSVHRRCPSLAKIHFFNCIVNLQVLTSEIQGPVSSVMKRSSAGVL